MRITLRRPLEPQNAASEVARALSRILKSDAQIASSPSAIVTIEEPLERAELRAFVEAESFARQVDWHLGELLGSLRVPPALHVHYVAGGEAAIEVEPATRRAFAARLDWGSSSFDIDGSKALLAVGRGPVRKRFPGARNDVVVEDSWGFVSRDAFALRWDPGKELWRLEIDEVGRAFIEIKRGPTTLYPQLSSIPLEYGDVIAVTAGPGSSDRLEIKFVRAT